MQEASPPGHPGRAINGLPVVCGDSLVALSSRRSPGERIAVALRSLAQSSARMRADADFLRDATTQLDQHRNALTERQSDLGRLIERFDGQTATALDIARIAAETAEAIEAGDAPRCAAMQAQIQELIAARRA